MKRGRGEASPKASGTSFMADLCPCVHDDKLDRAAIRLCISLLSRVLPSYTAFVAMDAGWTPVLQTGTPVANLRVLFALVVCCRRRERERTRQRLDRDGDSMTHFVGLWPGCSALVVSVSGPAAS